MSNDTVASSVDSLAVRGIAAKVQEVFAAPGTFLSFPLTPFAYLADDLRFLAPGGLTVAQAQTLGEFSELVNRIPLVSQVLADDGSGRHLWDVYGDVLGAELATSERTTAEEQVYQRAYAYLRSVRPVPPDPPSQASLDYAAYQAAYLAAESAWRNAKDTPDADGLAAAKDQAWADWREAGHKDDVEQARLTLQTLSDKQPSVAWSRYRTQFDPGMPADFATAPSGMRYAPSGFAPSGALDVPWARMTLDQAELASAASHAAPELVKALQNGSASGTVSSVSFDFIGLDITRPWFDSAMLRSHAWRFRAGAEPLSDGQDPPHGYCPAYVTKLVLARNISITRPRAAAGSASATPELAFIQALKPTFVAQRLRASIPSAMNPQLLEPEEHLAVVTQPQRAVLPKAQLTRVAGPARELVLGQPQLQRDVLISERRFIEPNALKQVNMMQRFDYPVRVIVNDDPKPPPPPPPPPPQDEVVTTAPEVVFVIAFYCRVLGPTPDPDLGLPWPD